MKIHYRNIILRDMRVADIEDEIRWNTIETEWGLWDAPWEDFSDFDPDVFREETLKKLQAPEDGFRWRLQVDHADGTHIGSVNSYLIDDSYEWIAEKSLQPDQHRFYAVGVDIKEPSYWGRGLGAETLAAYIRYHLELGHTDICTQTWSGNLRMIRCAEKLGFYECDRKPGYQTVREETVDGLTFRLDTDQFRRSYE
jgi:RimJ/RimL family protein N-acetyltransferase